MSVPQDVLPGWLLSAESFTAASRGDDEAPPRGVPGGRFLFDLYTDEEPPIWGRGAQSLWAAGEPAMLAGPQGAGKSTLAQQVVLGRLGLSDSLLGYPIRPRAGKRNKVLYLAMDRPRQIQRSLRRMVVAEQRPVLDRRLLVWIGPLAHLNVVRDPFALAEWIEAQHKQVGDLVIDSLKDLAVGLSNDDVGAAVNQALQEVVASGREVLVLHHNRKAQQGNKTPDKLDDIYGSNWLTAGMGSVVFLKGQPGGRSVELLHLKQPADVVGPLDVIHDHSTGRSCAARAELDVIDVLRKNGDDGATLDAVAVAVFHGNDAATKQRARRRLDALVAEGIVQYEPGTAGGAGGGAKQSAKWTLIQP